MKPLDQIAADLLVTTQITPDADLKPVGPAETILGTIEDQHARALWTLSREYGRLASLAQHAAQYDVTEPAARDTLLAEAQRYHSLSDLAEEAAWMEFKDCIGESAWNAPGVGIRSGFVLVTIPCAKMPVFPGAIDDFLKFLTDTCSPADSPSDRPPRDPRKPS